METERDQIFLAVGLLEASVEAISRLDALDPALPRLLGGLFFPRDALARTSFVEFDPLEAELLGALNEAAVVLLVRHVGVQIGQQTVSLFSFAGFHGKGERGVSVLQGTTSRQAMSEHGHEEEDEHGELHLDTSTSSCLVSLEAAIDGGFVSDDATSFYERALFLFWDRLGTF